MYHDHVEHTRPQLVVNFAARRLGLATYDQQWQGQLLQPDSKDLVLYLHVAAVQKMFLAINLYAPVYMLFIMALSRYAFINLHNGLIG